ncbi:MAG: metal-dependent transcriptional regulator [Clostridiales Family XIII bacterium]|jgi:Mn-dependent DtxR family transcriptional regulator|nr:metal-dependent transcriptional regulator [Clostridiales Family XIII bacterium]
MDSIDKNLNESSENYLETILLLQEDLGDVRSIDVANKLNFSRASISNAMANLSKKGLIFFDENTYIRLTKEGILLAKRIKNKHNNIKNFLIKILKVDDKTAEKDACKIEHIISEETFEKIERYLDGNKE